MDEFDEQKLEQIVTYDDGENVAGESGSVAGENLRGDEKDAGTATVQIEPGQVSTFYSHLALTATEKITVSGTRSGHALVVELVFSHGVGNLQGAQITSVTKSSSHKLPVSGNWNVKYGKLPTDRVKRVAHISDCIAKKLIDKFPE